MRSRLVVVTAAAFIVACTPDTQRVTLHLDGPLDMTVVCFENGAPVAEATCTDTVGVPLGYVVNGERGSISRLNLRTGEFDDTDAFIPGFTPKPIGLRPVSVVTAPDGTAVFSANVVARSLSRVDSVTLKVSTQALPGRPAALAFAGNELLVALPDEAAIARIDVTAFGSLTALPNIPLPEGSPQDLGVVGGGTQVWVAHADRAYVSLVDLATAAEIARVPLADPCRDDLDNDGNGLVDSADPGCRADPMGDEGAGPAPAASAFQAAPGAAVPQCMNGVDDDGDGATDYPAEPGCVSSASWQENPGGNPVDGRLAVSPAEDLVYVVNVRDRTVVVIDTSTRTRVDVNAATQPGASDLLRRLGRKDIHIEGVPTDVAFGTAEVDRADGSTKATVLKAYVASATGQITVIDVDELVPDPQNATQDQLLRTHRIRDSQTDKTARSRPAAPGLFEGTVAIDLGFNRRADRPSFGEYIADKPKDKSDLSKGYTDYGIDVVGAERVAVPEQWNVTHAGIILERRDPVATWDAGAKTLSIAQAAFCDAGVEVGDRLVLRPAGGGITDDSKCPDFLGKSFSFEIQAVTATTLTITAGSGTIYEVLTDAAVAGGAAGEPVPDPTAACFGRALAFEVRVPRGVYAVIGSVSGYLHAWKTQPDGSCQKDATADPRFVGRATEWRGTTPLVDCPVADADVDTYYQGTWFENHAIRFRMIPGCDHDPFEGRICSMEPNPSTPCRDQLANRGRPTDGTVDDLRWSFKLESAFVPKILTGLGTPRRLRSAPGLGRVYAVDSGLERIFELRVSDDVLLTAFF